MSGGFGDSRICSFVFNGGKIACSCYSTRRNKMATCDFGPAMVISCEKSAVFCIHLDYFMECNKQIVNTALNRSLNSVVSHVDL